MYHHIICSIHLPNENVPALVAALSPDHTSFEAILGTHHEFRWWEDEQGSITIAAFDLNQDRVKISAVLQHADPGSHVMFEDEERRLTLAYTNAQHIATFTDRAGIVEMTRRFWGGDGSSTLARRFVD